MNGRGTCSKVLGGRAPERMSWKTETEGENQKQIEIEAQKAAWGSERNRKVEIGNCNEKSSS